MTTTHEQSVTWTFYQYIGGQLQPFECTFPAHYSPEPDDRSNVWHLLQEVGYWNIGSLGDYMAKDNLVIQYYARRRDEVVTAEYGGGGNRSNLPYTWCVEIDWGRDADGNCERVEYVFIHDMAGLIPFLNSLVPLITCSFRSEQAINQTIRISKQNKQPMSVKISAGSEQPSKTVRDSTSE